MRRAAPLLTLLLLFLLLPATRAHAAASVNATLTITGGTQTTTGRWIITHDCTGPIFTFDIQVSNAPVHQAAIEAELHGFALQDQVAGLTGFAGGVATVTSSYDWTGPTYGTHVLHVRPTAGPTHTIPAGSSLSGRSFRLCANPWTPSDFPGQVTFRFVGIDGDTGNPISIPIQTVDTASRSNTGERAAVTRQGVTPHTHLGNPGFRLDFFTRFTPCLGAASTTTHCHPYVGTLTQTFTGPLASSAVFLSWELREPDDSAPFTAPDWAPEPPTGDPDDPFAPDGTQPGDFTNFLSLNPGDPMPATVDVPLRMWPTGVCSSELGHPIQAGPPWRAPSGTSANPCARWKDYGWRISIWVPEPPPGVPHTYTLGHTQVRDTDWDGTFEPKPIQTNVPASYTLLSTPAIRASVNHLEPKYGCTLGGGGDISGMPTALGPASTRCIPAEPNVNQGTSAIRFTWTGGVLLNPTVIDQIPPGFVLKGATNGNMSTFPLETPWTRYYHPGPCTLNTPRTDPGWVPAPSWTAPIEDVRCIMWHTPSTANNVEYPDIVVNYQRDPNVDPFVLPTALYPGIRGEESGSATDCFAAPLGFRGPVALQDPTLGSWQPLGTSPGGAGIHCVRWIIPNPYHSSQGPGQHPSPELTVAVFHVTPNGASNVFDPGESAYGRNMMWVYADNMVNPAPWPAYPASTLYWPSVHMGADGTTWQGNWNQTIFRTTVHEPSWPTDPLPAPPPIGGTMTVGFSSVAWHHTGLGSPAEDWAILARIPNGLILDPSFDPGGPDGLDGVQVLNSPRTVLGTTLGTPLPYTCQILPDGDPLPGGGYVFCAADGTTADNGVQDGGWSYGWRVAVRVFRMPGFGGGTWQAWSWNSLDGWDGNTNPLTPLSTSPFTPLANDPQYGLVDVNGAPYFARAYNYVTQSGASYRSYGQATTTVSSLPGYRLAKAFADPGSQTPPWPGGEVDYQVSLLHESDTNVDLSGVAVYDFLGRDPLSGAPAGSFTPEFVSVQDDDPFDDTAWTFSFWCSPGEDSTPTASEAASYTWEPTVTSGTCSGAGSVVGVRAVPTPVHLGVPGSYPLYFEQWDPGDTVSPATRRADGFVIRVRTPLSALPGEILTNLAAVAADQFSAPFGSGDSASTTEVDEVLAVDDPLGLHAAGAVLSSVPILANDSGGVSGLDVGSVVVLSGPTGGTVAVNGDGTITWSLPVWGGSWSFTYRVCNLNPEPRCDDAVVTAGTDGPPPPTTTTTTTVPPPPGGGGEGADLEVQKTAEPDAVTVGDTLLFRIVWRNLGPDPATNVTMTDVVPNSFTIISAPPSCSTAGQVVTCLLASLQPNPTRDPSLDAVTTIVVRAAQVGRWVNEAEVRGAESDPELGNNRSRAQVLVAETSGPLPETGSSFAPLAVAVVILCAAALARMLLGRRGEEGGTS